MKEALRVQLPPCCPPLLAAPPNYCRNIFFPALPPCPANHCSEDNPSHYCSPTWGDRIPIAPSPWQLPGSQPKDDRSPPTQRLKLFHVFTVTTVKKCFRDNRKTLIRTIVLQNMSHKSECSLFQGGWVGGGERGQAAKFSTNPISTWGAAGGFGFQKANLGLVLSVPVVTLCRTDWGTNSPDRWSMDPDKQNRCLCAESAYICGCRLCESGWYRADSFSQAEKEKQRSTVYLNVLTGSGLLDTVPRDWPFRWMNMSVKKHTPEQTQTVSIADVLQQ